MAAGLVAAAHDALPTPGAAVARDVLAADLTLLEDLADQIGATEARITALLPATVYQILTTTPGWGVIRAASYAAVLGTSSRWAFRRPQHLSDRHGVDVDIATVYLRSDHRIGAGLRGDICVGDGSGGG